MIIKLIVMKKLQNIIKPKILSLFFLGLGALPVFAQAESAATPASTSSFVLDVNTLLIFVVAILFFIILTLGYTLVASVGIYKKRKSSKTENVIKILLIALLMSQRQTYFSKA